LIGRSRSFLPRHAPLRFAQGRLRPPLHNHGYNLLMRGLIAGCLLLLLCEHSASQGNNAAANSKTAVTVPANIDHNRVVIRGELRLPDGSMQTIRVWVDNGNPDLEMSRRVATLLGLQVKCGDQECTSPPPSTLVIGGLSLPLSEVNEAKIPLLPVDQASVLALGLDAEMNLPSSVLRHYDVLVDFVDRKFSIGPPGSIRFRGPSGKVLINAGNGLIQVPSQIEGKKYNLALDVGSCISFLSEQLFDKMAATHADWPRMTGAVGSANMWGAPEEAKWNIMRLDRLQFGPLFFTNAAVVSLPKSTLDFFEKRVGTPTVGVVGSSLLRNYRLGIDYAHSMVYYELGRPYNFPDFDVVGLILRPERDGQFTILGVADFEGKPSIPVGNGGVQPGDHLFAVNDLPVEGISMGQVWSLLGGIPDKEKKLTIERGGQQFHVLAKVQHFLGEAPEAKTGKK